MKIASIAAITAVVLGVVGCHGELASGPSDAKYIAEHHCISDGELRTGLSHPSVVHGVEVPSTIKPYYAYHCPNRNRVCTEVAGDCMELSQCGSRRVWSHP